MVILIQIFFAVLVALGFLNVGLWEGWNPNHPPGFGILMIAIGAFGYFLCEIERERDN